MKGKQTKRDAVKNLPEKSGDEVIGAMDKKTGKITPSILVPERYIAQEFSKTLKDKGQELREGSGFLMNRFYVYDKKREEYLKENGKIFEIDIRNMQMEYGQKYAEYKGSFRKNGATPQDRGVSEKVCILALYYIARNNQKYNPVRDAYLEHIEKHKINNKKIVDLRGGSDKWSDEDIQTALNTIIEKVFIQEVDLLHTGNGGERELVDLTDIIQSFFKACAMRGMYSDTYAIKYEILPCFISLGGAGKNELVGTFALNTTHLYTGDFDFFVKGGYEMMDDLAGKSIYIIDEAVRYGHTANEKIRGAITKTTDRGRKRYSKDAIDVNRQWQPVVIANTFDITENETLRRYKAFYMGGTGKERMGDKSVAEKRYNTTLEAVRDMQFLAGLLVKRCVEGLEQQGLPHHIIEDKLKRFLYIENYWDDSVEQSARKEEEHIELLRPYFEGRRGIITTGATQDLLDVAYKEAHPDFKGVPYGEKIMQKAQHAIKFFGGVNSKQFGIDKWRYYGEVKTVWLCGFNSNELHKIRNNVEYRKKMLTPILQQEAKNTPSNEPKEQKKTAEDKLDSTIDVLSESNDFEIQKDYTIPKKIYNDLPDFKGDAVCSLVSCDKIAQKKLKDGRGVICEGHIV